jgi:putative component of toxin-antitoxin plasmid stabilization module
MPKVLEYLTPTGTSPFGTWFGKLDAVVAAKLTVVVTRMAAGNLGDRKSVGGGVLDK